MYILHTFSFFASSFGEENLPYFKRNLTAHTIGPAQNMNGLTNHTGMCSEEMEDLFVHDPPLCAVGLALLF